MKTYFSFTQAADCVGSYPKYREVKENFKNYTSAQQEASGHILK